MISYGRMNNLQYIRGLKHGFAGMKSLRLNTMEAKASINETCTFLKS